MLSFVSFIPYHTTHTAILPPPSRPLSLSLLSLLRGLCFCLLVLLLLSRFHALNFIIFAVCCRLTDRRMDEWMDGRCVAAKRDIQACVFCGESLKWVIEVRKEKVEREYRYASDTSICSSSMQNKSILTSPHHCYRSSPNNLLRGVGERKENQKKELLWHQEQEQAIHLQQDKQCMWVRWRLWMVRSSLESRLVPSL